MQLLHAYKHVVLASLLRGNQPANDFQLSPIFRPLQTRIRGRVISVSPGLHSERLGVWLILITWKQLDEPSISYLPSLTLEKPNILRLVIDG